MAFPQPARLVAHEGRDQDPANIVGNYYTTRYADAWDVAEKTAPQLDRLGERHGRLRLRLLPERPAAAGQGGRPLQPQHAAHADLLPHRGRPLLRLGGLRTTLPAAATARARTSGTTSRRRRSSSATSPGRCARSSSPTPRDDNGPDELPRQPAAGAGAGVRQGRRRRPDGLPHEAVPRLAAFAATTRCCASSGRSVAQGAGVLLDPRRLGRRPRRRHGGLPAQHHGRRVLRPEPADGGLVPGRAARGGGDGARRGRAGLRRRPAATSSSGAGRGSTRISSTASTTSTRFACRKSADAIAPGLRVGMGAGLDDPTTSSAPAASSTSSSASTWRTSAAWAISPTRATSKQTLRAIMRYNFRRGFHGHFNHLRSFVLGDESALADGDLPARPAAATSVPLLQRSDDRLRVHRRGRHALRGTDARRARAASPPSAPATTAASATPSTKPSAATTTPARWPAGRRCWR